MSKKKNEFDEKINDTWATPTLQISTLGIRWDEEAFVDVLLYLSSTSAQTHSPSSPSLPGLSSTLIFTTPYLNLPKHYVELLCQSHYPITLIAGSKKSNGFWKSAGLTYYVPALYKSMHAFVLNKITKFGKDYLIKLYEYEKLPWTYHGKGLWLHNTKQDNLEGPNVTFIGSSNFGWRSLLRDTEGTLIITTNNKTFQNELKEECKRILTETTEVTLSKNNKENKSQIKFPSIWIRFLSFVVKTFL